MITIPLWLWFFLCVCGGFTLGELVKNLMQWFINWLDGFNTWGGWL